MDCLTAFFILSTKSKMIELRFLLKTEWTGYFRVINSETIREARKRFISLLKEPA